MNPLLFKAGIKGLLAIAALVTGGTLGKKSIDNYKAGKAQENEQKIKFSKNVILFCL